jgi:RNA polymerase sigma factor (sigma-70 family)
MNAEELFETHYHIAKQTILRMFNNPKGICDQHRIEMDDLYQIARIGLWQAAQKYKPDQGTKFTTFAINNIRFYVKERLNRETSMIKYSPNRKYEANERYGILSIDAKQSDEGDNTYHDIIASNVDIETDIMNELSKDYILSRLTEKQRKVVELKIKGLNRKQISAKLNTSGEDVRSKLIRAKTRLEGLGYASNTVTRKSIDKSKGRKVSIEGKIYNRIMDACDELGISQSTVSCRLKTESDKFREWHYID